MKKLRIWWDLRRAEKAKLRHAPHGLIKTYKIGTRRDGSPILVDRSEFVRIKYGRQAWTLLQLMGEEA